jgi:2-C-methyl-D-erythritol 4-phosphate cytidylyltransferase
MPDVIVLAAGIGNRTKLTIPKQFMRISGKPLMIHILDIISKIKDFQKIIVSILPEYTDYYNELIKQYYDDCSKIVLVNGGTTRQESMFNCLQYVRTERVFIHESARPFINSDFINSLLNTDGDVVVPVTKSVSTVFYNNKYLNRDRVYSIQLPQVFNTDILMEAHVRGYGKNYTDDSSLVFEELGIIPTFVDGLDENIKITSPIDVKIAEVLWNEIFNCGRGQ